jgi:hypothetical protein
MRILWDTLEAADRLAFRLLDKLDQAQKKEPLLTRTQKRTAEVRPPQRVIEFGKN